MITRRIKSRTTLWAAVAAAILLGGCLFSKDEPGITSTEIPNELTGVLVLKDGSPVQGANVSVYPVEHLPMLPGTPKSSSLQKAHAVVTDADGRYRINGLTQGEYNILGSKGGLGSLRDSVTVTASGRDVGMDTLKATGAIAGWVRLQPDHSPRTAWIQAAGTSVFTNVAADGGFILSGLAEGAYQLRVSTTEPEYSPLFAPARIRAGATDTLKDTLVPYFSGIPIVTGLKASLTDSGRAVRLEWNASDYPHLEAYLVYRDSGSAPLPADTLVGRTSTTVFIDTVFSDTPGPGRIPLSDIQPHLLGYRVKILTKGKEFGPTYGGASIKVKSPSAITAKEAQWTRAVEAGRYFTGFISAAAVWKDTLWAVESRDTALAIWSSPDGAVWTKSAAATGLTAPYNEAIVNRNWLQIRILDGKAWMLMSQQGASRGLRNLLWSSTNMRTWSPVAMDPGFPGRGFAGFFAHSGYLWVCGGGNTEGPMGLGNLTDVWRSADGKAWERVSESGVSGFGFSGGAALHDSRMWLIGGGQPFYPDPDFMNLGVWSSVDGKEWARASHLPVILPRTGFALESFAGELWAAGGNRYDKTGVSAGATTWNDAGVAADVWSSTDGVQWSLRNAEAPFGARRIDVSAVWKNRLWIFGGSDATGKDLTDVWYTEAP